MVTQGINYLAVHKNISGMVRTLLTWLILLVVTISMAVMFGTPFKAAVLYAGYMAFFVILPGSLFLVLAARRQLSPIGFAATAVVVGQCAEMTVGMLAIALRLQEFYLFLPVLYLAAIWLTKQEMFRLIRDKESEHIATLLGCIVVAIFIVFAGSLFNFDEIVDEHFTWVAAFANAVSIHWPPLEPFLMDVPLNYHYLYNVHIGMASSVTGVPLILVASRLAIIFHAFSFILVLYAFSLSRLQVGWLGVVAATALLLTFGYSEIMWRHFHFGQPQSCIRLHRRLLHFRYF